MKSIFVNILLFLFCSGQAMAQTQTGSKETRWDIDFTTGISIGGPGDDMISFLLDEGYDYELYIKNQFPVIFDVNRALHKSLRLGLNISLFNQELRSSSGSGLNICSFKSVVYSPLISYNYKSFLFFAAGPSVNAISYLHPTGSSLNNDENFLKLGFTLKSGLEFPKDSGIHLRIEMQYCYGGTIDPYFSIESKTRQYFYTTLHSEKLSMNFFYAGIGLGFRIYSK